MKRLAILVAVIAGSAQAQLTVGANLYSWHSKSDYPEVYQYQSFTPGVYARYGSDWFVEGGVYRNSQGFVSPHIGGGYSWQWSRFDLSIAAGGVYGYRDWYGWVRPDGSTYVTYGPAELRAFVIPSIGLKLGDGWKARAFLIPAVEKDKVYCVSFALERAL